MIATKSMDYASAVVKRNPWIITTESWFRNGKFIALPLNPEAVDFNIPLRVAHETTYAAKFVYVWRRRRTNNINSQFQVNFNISSGNIIPTFDISTPEKLMLARSYTGVMPASASQVGDLTKGNTAFRQSHAARNGSVSVAGLYDKIVPIGVQNLYAMLALVEALNTYEGDSVTGGNDVLVGMSTMAFPQLLLQGSISTDGITFSMSADNPAEFTMSFSMLVSKTTPSLGYNSWNELVNTYKSCMFSEVQTVQWMEALRSGATPSTAADRATFGQPKDAGNAFEGSDVSAA